MGTMEAIVVVYLRKIFYPHGFDFPLTNLPNDMLILELIREISTLILLAVVAIITGKNKIQKLAWFIYTFAAWDIFFYIGLKISIGWPASLLTWDILFLIPVPWVAPILAPLICSITMILMGVVIIVFEETRKKVRIRMVELGMIIGGIVIILFSFMKDYLKFTDSFIPTSFDWPLFLFGETLILAAIVWNVFHTNRRINQKL